MFHQYYVSILKVICSDLQRLRKPEIYLTQKSLILTTLNFEKKGIGEGLTTKMC